ncbi:MAG: YgaP-like transmembrane domain [Candidatus Brocadiales bacterium]
MLNCNLESAQRWLRVIFGLSLLALAYGAHAYSYGRVFQWGLGLGGVFVLFEGLKGWCALKALGFRVPF